MDGWITSRLGDVAEYVNGKAFKPSDWGTKGSPIIRIQNLTKSRDTFNYYSGKVEPKYEVEDGDLLISWSATLGAYIYRGKNAVLNQHIFKVVPKINKMYLYYYVNFILSELKTEVHGTGMQHITKSKFDNIPIRLPTIKQQENIVVKIEELFSKLHAGLNSLNKVNRDFVIYKNSILNAVFKGVFSKNFRNLNERKLLEERHDMESLIRKRRTNQIELEDDLESPKEGPFVLPKSWSWTSVRDISNLIQYGISEKGNRDVGSIPLIRLGNIVNGSVELDDLKYVSLPDDIFSKFKLNAGDLLFARTSGSRNLVGKSAVYEENFPDAVFASYLIRVRVEGNLYSPFLLSYFINSKFGRSYLESVASQQLQANINSTKLSRMLVPLIPTSEQQYIMQELLDNLSKLKTSTRTTSSIANYTNALKLSILKMAFEGKLIHSHKNSKDGWFIEELGENNDDPTASRKSTKQGRLF